MRSRFVAPALLALLAAVAAPPAADASARSSAIKLTDRTVVISRATVHKYLVGVSKDRTTFKFKRAAGSLRRLRAGKVMLLKGSDAAKVTKVKHAKGRLVVTTKPVKLTELVRSGRIRYRGKPNFKRAFLVQTAPVAKARIAARRFEAPSFPYAGLPSPSLRAVAADLPSFSASGAYKGFGFSLTFTPVSQTRLNVTGTLSYGAAAPNNALAGEVKVNGYITIGSEDVSLRVDRGQLMDSVVRLKRLGGRAHIDYTLSSGAGTGGIGNPPVFRIPFSVDYSIPGPGGVPLYFKVSMAMVLKLGITSHNAVIRGGADVTSMSSDAIKQVGTTVTGSGTGETQDGSILSHQNGDVGPSSSALPSATVVALQFPKVGVGVGVRAVNLMGYMDRITTVTQTVSPAFGGIGGGFYCSHYELSYEIGGGFEAGLGPFSSIATPHKTFSEEKKQYTERGCPKN
jgi:hypothetical protein